MASGRGVLYIKWGTAADAALQRSLASLKRNHPELSVHVAELPPDATLLAKATLFDLSPFEQTLYLDADTVVMDRLDFGFDKAAQFGIACSICECPWARRYGGISGDVIEYNTGVLFFSRQTQPLFDRWKINVKTVDSSIVFRTHNNALASMPFNDQAGFALSIEQTGILPFTLPTNWNFRPLWSPVLCGPIKVWHDYSPVPPQLEAWTKRQSGLEKVIEFTQTR